MTDTRQSDKDYLSRFDLNGDIKSHIKSKSMWKGCSDPIKDKLPIIKDGKLIRETHTIIPVLLKLIDECIVNACDQYYKSKSKITYIQLNYDTITGIFSIKNNGDGIRVLKVDDKHFIELLFTKPLVGDNINKDIESITGGTNGVGVKVTVYHSEWFEIENCDGTKMYKQKYENECDIINPPIITDSTDKYTKIIFKPKYSLFCEENSIKDVILKYIYFRALNCKWYLPLVKVTLNDEEITEDYKDLITGEKFQLQLIKDKKFTWDATIFIDETRTKFDQVSVINGVSVRNGNHTKFILNEILTSDFLEKLAKSVGTARLTAGDVKKYIFIVSIMQSPGDNQWNGQCKDVVTINETYLKSYKYKQKDLKLTIEFIKSNLYDILSKKFNTTKTRAKIDVSKYNPAKKSIKSSLFLSEGDSASQLVKNGINYKETPLDPNYYGSLTLGGVIMSTTKHSKESDANGTKIIHKNYKENKFIKTFMHVVGLEFNKKYTIENFQKLNYGCIIIMTDQDLDGAGHICGLILSMIQQLWPELYDFKFVRRFASPIIRAFPKSKKGGTVLQYYTEKEFHDSIIDKSKYNIRYYKGLASTDDKKLTIEMFKNIDKNVIVYMYDKEKDKIYFETFFDKDAEKRKVELSTKTRNYTVPELDNWRKNQLLYCRSHLEVETKAYQIYNISRHMPNCIDGLNSSRRKIVAAITDKIFKLSNKRMKVYEIGAAVTKLMQYHHGDASINNTITKMAQYISGVNDFPLLKCYGEFGSKHFRGKNHGQFRYIFANLNNKLTDLLFSKDDAELLDYNFEDGEMIEPKQYIPTLPLVLLSYNDHIQHGWKSTQYPRHWRIIIAEIKRKILDENCIRLKLPIYLHNFKGRYNNFVTEGVYDYKFPYFTIYELPIGMSMKALTKTIEKHEDLIVEVKDNSTEEDTNIVIKLKENIDPLTIFNLTTKLDHKLYYIDGFVKDKVIYFESYEDVLHEWFVVRKRYYIRRIKRALVKLRLKKIYYTEFLRYCENYEKLSLGRKKIDIAEEILNKNNFKKFNTTPLLNFTLIHEDELEQEVLYSDKASYTYIHHIRAIDTYDKNIQLLKEKIAKIDKKIAFYSKDNALMNIWFEDLNNIKAVIEEGISSGWKFGEYDRFTY